MANAMASNSKPRKHYDVIVAGGGSAGVAAAVGAARLGARVLLVERYGFLGGAATNSMVLTYCGFYTGSADLVRTVGGVGWDLITRLASMGFDTAPVRSKSGNQIIVIDAEALKLALDRMVLAENIELNLHTRLVAATRDSTGTIIASLTIADHNGLHEVSADAFVDASGEACLAAFAGVPMSQPGGPGAHLQPASFPVRIDGVPPDAVFDRALMTQLVSDYNATAAMPMTRGDGGVVMRLPVTGNIWWMTVDLDTDGVSGADLSRAETLAREQSWRFMDVLRKHPGFEGAHLAATGPQIGIRESRRPRSLSDVTGADALAGRRSSEGIARASWPMEVHEAPGRQRFVPIGGDGFFDIPHGALCAEGAANLRLAGRVIGSDPEAYGSTRVMGTAFATGHAAGVSAALCATIRATRPDDAAQVRAELEAQNAIV
ncbi:FAD-dependent oxidoreductase [soil metagenome]